MKGDRTVDAGAEKLDALLHPTFDPDAEFDVLTKGVNASPGAAKGEVVFTAREAVDAAAGGRDVADGVLREVSGAAAEVGIAPGSPEASEIARRLSEVDLGA